MEVSDNTGGCEPEEVAGASPSISRNPMRSIEDMVEQNDNSFDGVINNVKVEPAAGTLEIVPDDKNPYWKIKGTEETDAVPCACF